ncbi:MAG: hypothetical protein AMDU3_IPLC00003G0005 [Thermoplasmatales archaeon I-plasma]|nr:MAG: hypothetical protein AMDU3_IPLC00003G0005 [Thermoplasmatales archaeon I-plasma]
MTLLLAILVLAAILSVFVFLFLAAVKTAMVEKYISAAEAIVSPYRDFKYYMSRKDRESVEGILRLASGSIRSWSPLMGIAGRGKRTDAVLSRSSELTDFVHNYPGDYAARQREVNLDFVTKAGLDRFQWEAVVKMDRYNMVLAPAGSGKTRCLTSRIAYLVKSGVSPSSMLALTYTRKATEEMSTRLKEQFGIKVEIRTLHSMASSIMRIDSMEHPYSVADENTQQKLLHDALMVTLADHGSSAMLSEFIAIVRTSSSTTAPAQHHTGYPLLNGLYVKSRDEQAIGNFFVLNGIRFDYEHPAVWADFDGRHMQYRPDFYLPDYDLYIEHWGIDIDGHVSDRFYSGRMVDPSEEYLRSMEWKRDQFRRHGKKLVQTYHYQFTSGTLLPTLASYLRQVGVQMHPIDPSRMDYYVQKASPILEPFTQQMATFISRAKLNRLTPDDIEARIREGAMNPIQKSFATLMLGVWRMYEHLKDNGHYIDYTDMLLRAVGIADAGRLPENRYAHILVDEFQDTNDLQRHLIERLMAANPQASLFCVGDDMQNIFSFAGSNVRNIIDFNRFFPHAERTTLAINYRCPRNVVEASVGVMQHSSMAIKKDVRPSNDEVSPITSLEYRGQSGDFDSWERTSVISLLDRIMKEKALKETVMVLSRYNASLDGYDRKRYGDIFTTVHRAKGREADYVILLGMTKGDRGFPSDRQDLGLFDITGNVKLTSDEKKKEFIEEERRVFYVAITRARKKLYILTSAASKSQFLDEISSFVVPYTG